MPEVVALARALPDTGEDRHTLVDRTDVADKLLDDHGLAHTRTAVGADLPALGERSDQVHDLQPDLQDLDGGGLLVEPGRLAMDGPVIVCLDFLQAVQGFTKAVEETPQRGISDRDGDRLTGIFDLDAADQPLGRAQCQTPDPAIPDVLLNLQDQALAVDLGLQSVVNRRHRVGWKLRIHHGTDDLGYFACSHVSSRVLCLF